ncbi:hypothetical protein [Tateyamaria sp.]|uniref:hypothetical protein n=1 Tax=Tateyamaria sp. TaxID=1929288 RepID=UPI00329B31C1
MTEISEIMVIDMLTFFHAELAVACAAGRASLDFTNRSQNGKSFRKVSVNKPCDVAKTVETQIEMVKAGKLKVPQ